MTRCPRSSVLLNAMLARGVTLPAGRGEGLGDRYVYQDSRGVPHEVSVCFAAVSWSEPSTAVGVYANRPRNVMRLRGLTPELATKLDARIDSRVQRRAQLVGAEGPRALVTASAAWRYAPRTIRS